jgi:hypothetical protein
MSRTMVKAVNYIKMDDEDHFDILFWRSKTVAERLEEVTRLRKNYYTGLNGMFPSKMVKVVTIRKNDF